MRIDFWVSPTGTPGSKNHLPALLIPENIHFNKSELQALLPTKAMPCKSEMNGALLVVPEPTQKIKSALQLRRHMLLVYWKWEGNMLWSSPFHVSVSLTMLLACVWHLVDEGITTFVCWCMHPFVGLKQGKVWLISLPCNEVLYSRIYSLSSIDTVRVHSSRHKKFLIPILNTQLSFLCNCTARMNFHFLVLWAHWYSKKVIKQSTNLL